MTLHVCLRVPQTMFTSTTDRCCSATAERDSRCARAPPGPSVSAPRCQHGRTPGSHGTPQGACAPPGSHNNQNLAEGPQLGQVSPGPAAPLPVAGAASAPGPTPQPPAPRPVPGPAPRALRQHRPSALPPPQRSRPLGPREPLPRRPHSAPTAGRAGAPRRSAHTPGGAGGPPPACPCPCPARSHCGGGPAALRSHLGGGRGLRPAGPGAAAALGAPAAAAAPPPPPASAAPRAPPPLGAAPRRSARLVPRAATGASAAKVPQGVERFPPARGSRGGSGMGRDEGPRLPPPVPSAVRRAATRGNPPPPAESSN